MMKKTKAIFAIAVSMFSFNAIASQGDCGVREAAAALATINMELNLLGSGLYEDVRASALTDISQVVLSHVSAVQSCNRLSQALQQNAIDSINTLVVNNPDDRDYSLGTAQRIYSTFQENVRLLESAVNQDLENKLKNCRGN